MTTFLTNLKPGFYRYVRSRKGEIALAFDHQRYHSDLAKELGIEPECDGFAMFPAILSAGFFHVDDMGNVTIPVVVPIIDHENKTNRSIGLGKEPWTEEDWPDYPPDLQLILAKLKIGVDQS